MPCVEDNAPARTEDPDNQTNDITNGGVSTGRDARTVRFVFVSICCGVARLTNLGYLNTSHLGLPQKLLVHPDDANSHHLTVYKVLNLQAFQSLKSKGNSSRNSNCRSHPKNGISYILNSSGIRQYILCRDRLRK